ncbi:lipid A deacylase LpxR family protein [Marinibactrum halimedae]|uniref:Lipid A deacylase LpxR family protein n=1 Tax=Marinibactrum halimedae TaxID=1444977 RepID=A0AA37T580_9GAMM|nr:lipid A deacylase LpxR family protein [Marinibactrum halimedae]MCD9459444.1 lipid A deacylase LpxR family protein [Marinibactrum halimedae]GLS27488.1 hypothetical protein GCM10007877_32070 [Marinibactrum halimedae]
MILVSKTYGETPFNWASITIDNDLFVGNDNGYTNGLYISLYQVGPRQKESMTKPDFWVKPLLWLWPSNDAFYAINSYTLGQSMVTPLDTQEPIPSENELPYSGVLFLINNYVMVSPKKADKFSTTVGVVGPASGAEQTQNFVHDLIGSDRAKGWDTQMENEFVFQFSRARLWRNWVSKSSHWDLLTQAEINLGTIESSGNAAIMLRTGRLLDKSYHTPLYANTRVANPVAPSGGWYAYFGIQGGYVARWLYTDGTAFRDGPSVSYDRERLGVTAGVAFSLTKHCLVTLALTETNLLLGGDNREVKESSRFGTLTFAWQR